VPAVNHLFVYGSLRKANDGSLHALFKNQALFMGNANLSGKLYLIDNYPGLVLVTAFCGYAVQGEVYRLNQPNQLLKKLDEYEECTQHFRQPHEYRRLTKSVTLSNERRLTCWVYVYNRQTAGLTEIIGGDFLSYLPQSHLKQR
jgi:gamma-glutamylcyclotransferase (GGCT)/AIG2-like uncharacterized protein YtfP